jgi:hypothetical protein
MSVNRASEVWKEIKPFALRDLKALQDTKNADSGINSGYYIILYDVSAQKLRYYSASPTGLQAALAAAATGDIVWLPAVTIQTVGGSSYTAGSELSTGAITVTSESGHTVSGLDAGSLYAIASTGGPWNNGGPNQLFYSIKISDDGGTTWVEHANSGWVEYDESLGNNKQLFFRPSGSSIKVRVADTAGQFADNTGSLGYSLKDASAIYPTVIPAGVEVAGLGENCILDGGVENNGMLTNIQVTGAIIGIGSYHAFDSDSAWQTNKQIISDLATGTSPFEIASTTLNTNLNADLLDGMHASEIVGQGFLKYNAIGTITHIAGNVTIIDNSLHNGFPSACLLADGTIVVVYREATDHYPSSDSVVVMKKSTDGGASWSAASTIQSEATNDIGPAGLIRLSSGRLLCAIMVNNFTVPYHTADGVFVIYSDDDGATWSSRITLNSGFTYWSAASGRLIQRADGTVLLGLYSRNVGDSYESASIMSSSDEGETWINEVVIGDGPADSRYYQEPSLLILPNGEILCFMRSDTAYQFYLSRSFDGGGTWSVPELLFTATGRPDAFRAQNGLIVVWYRETSGSQLAYRVSKDNGYTWGSEIISESGAYFEAYSSAIEYEPGMVGVIFGKQFASTNCDIFITKYYSTLEVGQLVSNVPTGIPPVAVDSQTVVNNLNSDMVDGEHIQKRNMGASTAPGTGDDSGDGYAVGSRWFDTTADKEYVCLDASVGAAVWKETTATSGGAGTGDVVGPASAVANHLAVFDGVTGKLIKDGGAIPAGSSTDGWTAAGETWTYNSADDPVYVVDVDADVTGKYSPGMRVKFAQATGGVKYGIIHAVGTYASSKTPLTIYMGTDYDLVNEAISSPFWSVVKAPVGFPLNPAKWTVAITPSNDTSSQANPTNGTWYNLGSLSLSVPIGIWKIKYTVLLLAAGSGSAYAAATLSTANNSESDVMNTCAELGTAPIRQTLIKEFNLILTSKTTYYLNESYRTTGGTSIQVIGTVVRNEIAALCAYL